MRRLLQALGTLGAVALAVFLFGVTRPESHVARTRARYASPPEALWETLTDLDRWPEWNPEVRSVERLPDRGGHTVVSIVGPWGAAATEITVVQPPARFRTEMEAGGFGGSWSYELEPSAGGGTLLTVTEEGRVGNPFIRAMMPFHDSYASMTAFHRALGARLGEVVEPERLEGAAGPSR